MSPQARLVQQPIDVGGLIGAVSRPSNGAILLFLGLVRDVNQGRGVTGIEYSAYEAMAARELQTIVEEAADRFGVEDLVVEHRLGTLGIEEASVGIAVAHGHRAEVYDVSRWVIEELKRRVPIWKREHYLDGAREWVNAGTGAPASAAEPAP